MRAALVLVLALAVAPKPAAPARCAKLRNLALNGDASGKPSPVESDRGWGGGAKVWELVDGRTSYEHWAHGLAFTGGDSSWAGESAGPRQATIDFGPPRTFERLVVWQHGDAHTPAQATVEVFSNDRWAPIAFTRAPKSGHAAGKESGYADADVFTFSAPVFGSKVRYGFDNRGKNLDGTQNIHGWIYEIEAFGCDVSPRD